MSFAAFPAPPRLTSGDRLIGEEIIGRRVRVISLTHWTGFGSRPGGFGCELKWMIHFIYGFGLDFLSRVVLYV